MISITLLPYSYVIPMASTTVYGTMAPMGISRVCWCFISPSSVSPVLPAAFPAQALVPLSAPAQAPVPSPYSFPHVWLDSMLWHQCFGHIGMDATRSTLLKDYVKGVMLDGSFICDHCILVIVTGNPGVHCDQPIAGPSQTHTRLNGYGFQRVRVRVYSFFTGCRFSAGC